MPLRDPVSSASHLFMGVWAIYALAILLRLTPVSSGRRFAVLVFGGSMAFLYLASGVFHAVPFTGRQNPFEFRLFQRIDQSAIFVLIAGTNTPIIVTFLGQDKGRHYLRGMWGLAAIGVASLWIFPRPPHELIVIVCLGMGWLGFVPMVHYYRAVGWRAMNWVWAGGALYTLGALCEIMEWPKISDWPVRFGFHEVFHLLSAAASVAFFLFVVWYVIPYRVK